VTLVAPRALSVTMPRGEKARYTLSLRYKGPLKAPIAKGETVANLLVRVPGEPVHILPLVAGEAVLKGGVLTRLRNGAMEMVGL
jgi:D-alanyl-D-alanine carboxypeptidase (penicillin-binding protein 5/6)